MLPMPNFTERRDKDRAVVPPTSLVVPGTMAVIVPCRPGRQTLSSGWASPLRHRYPCHCPGCCCLPSNLVAVAIALAAVAIACFVTRHPRPPLSPSPSPSPSSSSLLSLSRHHCLCCHRSCRRCHCLFVTHHPLHRRHRPCHPHPPSSSPITHQPLHHHHHPLLCLHCCHCPCRRQLPTTLVDIALATEAIALFVELHPCRQHHHPLHPPCPLHHPPPLSPPCRPQPFQHMLPLLVDCFFTFIVGWAVSQQVSQHAMICW